MKDQGAWNAWRAAATELFNDLNAKERGYVEAAFALGEIRRALSESLMVQQHVTVMVIELRGTEEKPRSPGLFAQAIERDIERLRDDYVEASEKLSKAYMARAVARAAWDEHGKKEPK